MKKYKTLLITDFTSDILKGYLGNDKNTPHLKVSKSPYIDCLHSFYNQQNKKWNDGYEVRFKPCNTAGRSTVQRS